jgi:hypothetical protein
MFTYFLQKKGFLADDMDYLVRQLKRVQQEEGENRFYRRFLLGLFHEGLGRAASARKGRMEDIPYLNGGLFAPYELEKRYAVIQIDDAAFEEVFAFFDAYRWHLGELPGKYQNEINPDILGYIFEKYINQQQMGAYYTREDVTAYIAKNCILPALFDAVERRYPEALGESGAVWRLLRKNPERYIVWGIQREEYLANETEREYAVRRGYYERMRERIIGGEICNIDDLITYNLDIELFAQDALRNIDEIEVVDVFYEQIRRVTILDPTCGSGHFCLRRCGC